MIIETTLIALLLGETLAASTVMLANTVLAALGSIPCQPAINVCRTKSAT